MLVGLFGCIAGDGGVNSLMSNRWDDPLKPPPKTKDFEIAGRRAGLAMQPRTSTVGLRPLPIISRRLFAKPFIGIGKPT